MTLLYMPRPLPLKQLDLFVKETSKSEREAALDLLHRYHIFQDAKLKSGTAYTLTPDFAKSLRIALTGAGNANSFGQVVEVPSRNRTSIAFLDEYSRQRWEGILGFMVGSSAVSLEDGEETLDPSPAVVELLRAGHLIELSGTASRGQTPRITKEGFGFVLQDINTQIWSLLFLYVDSAEDLGMDKVDMLSFLFLVSSLELGLAYSTEDMDDTQRRMLLDLNAFGIVYLRDDEDHFYPTRLATTLTSDSETALSTTNATLGSSLASSGASQGFIVIETNYRVYAYTSSPLQIALLSLFINLKSRHPNLVTGKMTKWSVQRAVLAGITAEQIISFLATHAHPQMKRRAQAEQAKIQARNADEGRVVPTLPATIVDQIHLWQIERDRMTTTAGFLIKEFQNHAEYEAPCQYADELGVLVWKNDKKRMFFVSRIEKVRDFMNARKHNS